uniref:Uncharacterized protein n=1 Tax=Brassica oleracea TaxID=3712 RepID=A0A3P6FSF0_BRAOL|nr:unnamed protein product [Brassica oleracea]
MMIFFMFKELSKINKGITCASFLRRIYEESLPLRLRNEQGYCFKFLSTYILTDSINYSLLQTWLEMVEVDEVLRLGVYALIDSCSVEDRQYLHTVSLISYNGFFLQGPCRNYLAALKEDHKLNFKFEGKV